MEDFIFQRAIDINGLREILINRYKGEEDDIHENFLIVLKLQNLTGKVMICQKRIIPYRNKSIGVFTCRDNL